MEEEIMVEQKEQENTDRQECKVSEDELLNVLMEEIDRL